MVTVYSQPACVQCTATCKFLERQGTPYQVLDVSTDADALATVKELGYMAAPVVVTATGEHWSGFQPDRLKTLSTA